MPSKSKKQAKLMRAVAHGWKPNRIKGPTRTVAQEFVDADERRSKVDGYRYGGYNRGGEMDYDEYQFGGGVPRGGMPYRGVPPQRGGVLQGGGGYGRPGGVPGTIGGFGGYQGGGGGGGRQGLTAPWQGPGPSPMSPMYGRMGALRQMMQQRGGGGQFGGGNRGPILSPYEQAESRMRGLPPGGGAIGGPPGIHDPQDMLMGEGPGGRLEQEGLRRQAKMRAMQGAGGPRGRMNQAQNRFGAMQGRGGPGGVMQQAQNRFGALTQGGPGGGSFGKPRPSVPGRRIAPPPRGRGPIGGRGGRGRFGGRGGRGGRGAFSNV